MSKDLSQLTPEELINLAKNPIQDNRKVDKNPVKEFILGNKVEPGDYPVSALIIYDRYYNWCKANAIKPITERLFFMELKHHFPKKVTRYGIFYTVSPKGFDLSGDHLSKLKAQFRKRNSAHGRKKKDKAKS